MINKLNPNWSIWRAVKSLTIRFTNVLSPSKTKRTFKEVGFALNFRSEDFKLSMKLNKVKKHNYDSYK